VETTAAMAAAALGERRRRRTKNHERKNCNENYRQGLFHFSPSNPTTRDYLAGTNLRWGTCVGSPPTAPSYTRAALRATLLPTQTATAQGRCAELRRGQPPLTFSAVLPEAVRSSGEQRS
jgi:hypothetical protein